MYAHKYIHTNIYPCYYIPSFYPAYQIHIHSFCCSISLTHTCEQQNSSTVFPLLVEYIQLTRAESSFALYLSSISMHILHVTYFPTKVCLPKTVFIHRMSLITRSTSVHRMYCSIQAYINTSLTLEKYIV